MLNRRDFLKTSTLGAAVGVMLPNGVWGLNKLEPIGNPLGEYPYRDWEDLYRKEWTWDHVGYSAHCVNCAGNCAFKIYAKDGIVLREEQLAQYPQINSQVIPIRAAARKAPSILRRCMKPTACATP